jgi:hypothetical protein
MVWQWRVTSEQRACRASLRKHRWCSIRARTPMLLRHASAMTVILKGPPPLQGGESRIRDPLRG